MLCEGERPNKKRRRPVLYIDDDRAHTKVHSGRCKRIMQAVMDLETASQPFVFLYIARPESVLSKRAKPVIHMSPTLQEAFDFMGNSCPIANIEETVRSYIDKQKPMSVKVQQGRQAQMLIVLYMAQAQTLGSTFLSVVNARKRMLVQFELIPFGDKHKRSSPISPHEARLKWRWVYASSILRAWQVSGELQITCDWLLNDGDEASGQSSISHSSTYTNVAIRDAPRHTTHAPASPQPSPPLVRDSSDATSLASISTPSLPISSLSSATRPTAAIQNTTSSPHPTPPTTSTMRKRPTHANKGWRGSNECGRHSRGGKWKKRNHLQEAYKQVYNWQYAHCVDFWSLVLGRACDAHAEAERGGQESELRPLIYPLVQVSLGAIKLISNSRSYPFHLHIARSMVYLTRHTRIYVPLTPYLLPIISSTLTASGKPKSSTLRPLNMETHIRAPAQYVRTRVYTSDLFTALAIVIHLVAIIAYYLSPARPCILTHPRFLTRPLILTRPCNRKALFACWSPG
ncbi:Noc2p family-domain-containing protein [Suillus placidus]|uniref:Noc2p family-domain-containing protein n=1 Tax=Suillus placidus TaxID=48579 RepID=A0A9P7CVI0_9AGAM|nr:Noc2p family-domain-containing protein [Suillus placidus]